MNIKFIITILIFLFFSNPAFSNNSAIDMKKKGCLSLKSMALNVQTFFKEKNIKHISGEELILSMIDEGCDFADIKERLLSLIEFDVDELKDIRIIGINHGVDSNYESVYQQTRPFILEILKQNARMPVVGIENYRMNKDDKENYGFLLEKELKDKNISFGVLENADLYTIQLILISSINIIENAYLYMSKLVSDNKSIGKQQLINLLDLKRVELFNGLSNSNVRFIGAFNPARLEEPVQGYEEFFDRIANVHTSATKSLLLLSFFRSIVMLNNAVKMGANFIIVGAEHALDLVPVFDLKNIQFLLFPANIERMITYSDRYLDLSNSMKIWEMKKSFNFDASKYFADSFSRYPFYYSNSVIALLYHSFKRKDLFMQAA